MDLDTASSQKIYGFEATNRKGGSFLTGLLNRWRGYSRPWVQIPPLPPAFTTVCKRTVR
jgi:hypothetical protein